VAPSGRGLPQMLHICCRAFAFKRLTIEFN
jgi:hypothetical protein